MLYILENTTKDLTITTHTGKKFVLKKGEKLVLPIHDEKDKKYYSTLVNIGMKLECADYVVFKGKFLSEADEVLE